MCRLLNIKECKEQLLALLNSFLRQPVATDTALSYVPQKLTQCTSYALYALCMHSVLAIVAVVQHWYKGHAIDHLPGV